MNSTHDDGWVTDPQVIRTIVLMKALRPGDEVRLKDCMLYGIGTKFEGDVVTLKHTDSKDDNTLWDTTRWPHLDRSPKSYNTTPVASEDSGYYLAIWNIAAWRRPLKETK